MCMSIVCLTRERIGEVLDYCQVDDADDADDADGYSSPEPFVDLASKSMAAILWRVQCQHHTLEQVK